MTAVLLFVPFEIPQALCLSCKNLSESAVDCLFEVGIV